MKSNDVMILLQNENDEKLLKCWMRVKKSFCRIFQLQFNNIWVPYISILSNLIAVKHRIWIWEPSFPQMLYVVGGSFYQYVQLILDSEKVVQARGWKGSWCCDHAGSPKLVHPPTKDVYLNNYGR